MATVRVQFNHAKVTKGAHRYEVDKESTHFPFLKSIYLTKEVLANADKYPETITITAEIPDELLKGK